MAEKQRQTLEDWFNVANSRNTAICMADGEWIAFVDDLSVLMPGWLALAGQAAMHPKTITLCRYAKVRDLVVENGKVIEISPRQSILGVDNRGKHVRDIMSPHPCT